MTGVPAAALTAHRPPRGLQRSYADFRAGVDQRVLRVFTSRALHRSLREGVKVNLALLWDRTATALAAPRRRSAEPALKPSDVHRAIVAGLPGEALYLSSAMAFDSMSEALPFFELSAKTAKLKLGERLGPHQGEMALRIGRVLVVAGEVLGSLEAARAYLRTPNFALGGALPRDLLKTAEGEQLVLSELQTQAAGGPV
jgi:putative toxin-antitoxin system antitoxin component (TIGR02293 family)